LVSSQVTRRRLGASLAQRVNEALAICIIHEDQFAPVTTIHDVRQQTRLSICGLGQESGFGRYTYQYQEPLYGWQDQRKDRNLKATDGSGG
jgi:hypothetical protein